MKQIWKLLVSTAMVLIIITVWLLWPDSLDSGMIRRGESESLPAVPDYLMQDFRYVSVRGAKREMEILSDTAIFFIKRQEVRGKEITAYFFNDQGERTQLKGREGDYSFVTQKLEVREDVKSKSPDGFVMLGEIARYHAEKRVLTSPQPVEGYTAAEDLRIWGDTARAPVDQRLVVFTGNARAHYQDARRGLTKVRGDKATLYRAEEKVRFQHNVRMNQTGMEMDSHEASLFYSQSKGSGPSEVHYLVATGDVHIRENESRSSRSQKAEFFAETDSVVLTGFPSVFDGRDTVTGDKLTLFRQSGIVEVQAANAAFTDQERSPAPVTGQADKELKGEDLELVIPDDDL